MAGKRGCLRWAAQQDSNHQEIVLALRTIGASVEELKRVGKGCPDLLVGYLGVNYLLEVKPPGKKLGKDQVKWRDGWLGLPPIMVTTIEEAFKAIGAEYEE